MEYIDPSRVRLANRLTREQTIGKKLQNKGLGAYGRPADGSPVRTAPTLCMKDNQMNDTRSKWLRSALGTVAAWWSFWICLVVLLVITIGIADAVIPGDGLPLLPGSILACISLAVAILGAIRFVRYQDRYMGRRSVKANYIVLAIMILTSLVLMPAPFFFTIF
jgi:hypothetical protein